MAIIWAESFDLYGTNLAALTLRGYSTNSGSISTAFPRTGTHSYFAPSDSTENLLTYITPSPYDEIGHGAAIRLSSLPGTATDVATGLWFWRAGADPNRWLVVPNANLGVSIYRGGGGSLALLGSSANGLMSLNTYYWLEAKLIRDPATNTASIDVRLNDTPILSVNGTPIIGQLSRVSIGNGGSGGFTKAAAYFDDWVVWNTSGPYDNDFLGDTYCPTRFANADGVLQDFAPSTGAIGYLMIDDTAPSDTDYIFSANFGDISDFDLTAIPFVPSGVKAIVPVVRAFKAVAGGGSFSFGVHNSGIDSDMSAPVIPGTTPLYYSAVFSLDPATGLPWTTTGANAAGFRVEYV